MDEMTREQFAHAMCKQAQMPYKDLWNDDEALEKLQKIIIRESDVFWNQYKDRDFKPTCAMFADYTDVGVIARGNSKSEAFLKALALLLEVKLIN